MSAAATTIAPARPLPSRLGESNPTIVEQPAAPPRNLPVHAGPRPANEVRLARAALKRDIAAGRRDVTDVIASCPGRPRA